MTGVITIRPDVHRIMPLARYVSEIEQ